MNLAPGDSLGRYVVEQPLGAGGMGSVVRALDVVLDRRVALKLVLPDRKHREESILRFHREARLAAQLTHVNTVRIYDIGEWEGVPFLVMEYVDGDSLLAYVGIQDVPVVRKLRWLVEMAHGLHAAHLAGLVHRDVKPANVMIGRDDVSKIVDFGLAKRQDTPAAIKRAFDTATGVLLGTPSYMAPEQLEGRASDARSDQFSWAVTAYALLSGNNPRASDPRRAGAITRLDRLKGVPKHVADVIERAYAYDPNDRWPTMLDAAQSLEEALRVLAPSLKAFVTETMPRIVAPLRFCANCREVVREDGLCLRCITDPRAKARTIADRGDGASMLPLYRFERVAAECPVAPLRTACFASRGTMVLALGAEGLGQWDGRWARHNREEWQRDILGMRRGADGKTVVMVGRRGRIVSLSKTGAWASLSVPTDDPDAITFHDVAFVDSQMVLAGERRGERQPGVVIRMTTKGAATIRSEVVLTTLAFAPRRQVLYGAGQGKICRINAGGVTVLHDAGIDILAIAELGSDVFAVGVGGLVLRIDAAGGIHAERVDASGALLAIAAGAGQIWACTSHGGIVRRDESRWRLASNEQTADTGIIAMYVDDAAVVTGIAVDGAIVRGHPA